MWIETIKIDGGTLDGFRQTLSRGLNVFIGGRGTGKSSVLELIRFCLGAQASSDTISKEALEHALGVLGDGKVTIILSNDTERFEVSRIATNKNSTRPFEMPSPVVFSQKEVEQIGARSHSRLRLIDAFLEPQNTTTDRKASLEARIKSLSAEIRSLFYEIQEVSEKLLVLPFREEQLIQLRHQGSAQSALSTELDRLRKQVDELMPKANELTVRLTLIERSAIKLDEWIEELQTVAQRCPMIEPWPVQAGSHDQLAHHRADQQAASEHLKESLARFYATAEKLDSLYQILSVEKVALDSQARDYRQNIEEQQRGASILDRKIADLSQEIAALGSLAELRKERIKRIDNLRGQRQLAIHEMHASSQKRTAERQRIASVISDALAPSIRVTVNPLADYRNYQNVLYAALRGTGLRYRELAERIVATVSPQEIANLAELGEVAKISATLQITEERAHRIADGLRGDAGIGLLTTEVGDEVEIQLLDGTSFKNTEFLSMGQRCTAVLPIILQHTDRVVVLDQPEDHLDNAFIVGTLVKAIRSRGPSAQTIIATHNPNIPVLGEADWVAHLESDGERCFVQVAGRLTDYAVVNSITTIMEGGRMAFNRRAAFYADNGASDVA